MLKTTLIEFFERDLYKLKEELTLYSVEQSIWNVERAISNSAGNLCLHLIGNLNHYIGATLGGTGYVRDRPSEFSLQHIPRGELISRVKDTAVVVRETLEKLAPSDFEKVYPLEWNEKQVKTGYMLVHLATHLNYHLGQVNYHRRLIGK